jgi:hypothetical protein
MRAKEAGTDPAFHGKAQRSLRSGEAEILTPPKYIEMARRVLGTIGCDPATCAEAQKIVRATTHYTRADDGLS